jgi:hypothetical protein
MSHFIELRYSNDGGNNYGGWKLREGGDTGQFLKPLIWRRLGFFKEQRIYEFRDTSDVAAEVLGCFVDVEAE